MLINSTLRSNGPVNMNIHSNNRFSSGISRGSNATKRLKGGGFNSQISTSSIKGNRTGGFQGNTTSTSFMKTRTMDTSQERL